MSGADSVRDRVGVPSYLTMESRSNFSICWIASKKIFFEICRLCQGIIAGGYLSKPP